MKTVLILGCNVHSIPYIEELKKLRYQVIGADKNPAAEGRFACDDFYCIGYDEFDKLIDVCDEQQITKVFTASCQHATLMVAKLSEYLGIEYMSSDTIGMCLDKVVYYNLFKYCDVPIPITIVIKNYKQLVQLADNKLINAWYLKSDYSKNPNYIYRFESLDEIDINWEPDQYFSKAYVLQPEVIGKNYRINMYNWKYNIYNFEVNDKSVIPTNELIEMGIISKLQYLTEQLGFTQYIVKYDVIVNDDGYVVLDIGLDRPYRMMLDYAERGINFHEMYVNHYINGVIDYE